MKIAILTIQSINYGNRLQNYALQKTLERMGHQVESLRREAHFSGSLHNAFHAAKRKLGILKHRTDKVGAFRRFDRRYVSFSKATVSKEYVTPGFSAEYDCCVIGSDQVWNPDFHFNSELEYLPMVRSDKKLAYAASFGVSEIKENRELTASYLDSIAFVSVRETAGAKIIYDLTGREVPVVLDPTLLLGSDDWRAIASKPSFAFCDTPFAFKYVLGDDVNNMRIDELAERHGLAVIDAMDDSLSIGPSEFVWLVAHSSLVCTDSFHASVFALLYHKPLAIFERVSADADMSSRFDTLCSTFGLVGHRSSESSFGEDAIFGTDWDDVDGRLGEFRKSSLFWLENALNGVKCG